jgi:hypothetical protein
MGKFAIIIVLTVIISSSYYTSSLRQVWLSSDLAAAEMYNNDQARNIAQSAALMAVRKIVVENQQSYIPTSGSTLNDPPNAIAFNDFQVMRGQYRNRVSNDGDTLITIVSRGKFRDSHYDVEVILTKESDIWEPKFPHSVFALSGITMAGSARIIGNVGTNSATAGSVTFSGSSRVDSSLSIGPGANPFVTVVNGANVRGEIHNLEKEMNYGLPKFPEFPAKLIITSNINVTRNRIESFSSSSYHDKFIPSVTISNGGTAQIATDNVDRVMHVGNLDILSGHLNISGTGKVTIYVENRITLGGNSTVNSNRQTPDNLFVYYNGTNALSLAGTTGFRGGLFVEKADINLSGTSSIGSGGVAGNIISGGNNITISGNTASLSRIIYAPKAHVHLTGSGIVKGSIICKTFYSDGDGRVEHPGSGSTYPALPLLKKSEKPGFAVGYWR